MTGTPTETASRPMFMETFNLRDGEDLVEIGLMDCGPDGGRPEVDLPLLLVTVPLSQLGPLLDDIADAYNALPGR